MEIREKLGRKVGGGGGERGKKINLVQILATFLSCFFFLMKNFNSIFPHQGFHFQDSLE